MIIQPKTPEICGNFCTIDPVSDFIDSFSVEDPVRPSDQMAGIVLALYDRALDTLVRAPGDIFPNQNDCTTVESDPLFYKSLRGLGHITLSAVVFMPYRGATNTEVVRHMQQERSPVLVVAGPGTLLSQQIDSEIFRFQEDASMRKFPGDRKTVLASPKEINYASSLLRKMRKAWNIVDSK